jgi:hypothetical protein
LRSVAMYGEQVYVDAEMDADRQWHDDLRVFNEVHHGRGEPASSVLEDDDDIVRNDYAVSRFLTHWHPSSATAGWPNLTAAYQRRTGARYWDYRAPEWWLVQLGWRCEAILYASYVDQVEHVQQVLGARLYEEIVPIIAGRRRTPRDILSEMPYDTVDGRELVARLVRGLSSDSTQR